MAEFGNTGTGDEGGRGPDGRRPDARTVRRQEAVALLLAGGSSVRAAARQTRIGARTIHRWLEDQACCDLIFTTRNRLFERAVARLSRLGGKAASTLGQLLDSPDPRIRLGAAKSILDTGKT